MINSRKKGARIENFFARHLREYAFPDVVTTRSQQAWRGGVDLQNTDPFSFEIKGGKKLKQAFYSKQKNWREKLNFEAKKENYQALLIKPDRDKPFIVMSFEDFKNILNLLKKENII